MAAARVIVGAALNVAAGRDIVAALDCVVSVGASSGGLVVWFRMWSASNPVVVACLEAGKGCPLQLLRSACHRASGVWLAGVAVALLVALTPADPLGVLVRVLRLGYYPTPRSMRSDCAYRLREPSSQVLSR